MESLEVALPGFCHISFMPLQSFVEDTMRLRAVLPAVALLICVCFQRADAQCPIGNQLAWRTDGSVCFAVTITSRCPKNTSAASIHSPSENALAASVLLAAFRSEAALGGYVSTSYSMSSLEPRWFNGMQWNYSNFSAPLSAGCITIDADGGWHSRESCTSFTMCRGAATFPLSSAVPDTTTEGSTTEQTTAAPTLQTPSPSTTSSPTAVFVGWTEPRAIEVAEFSIRPLIIPTQNVDKSVGVLIGFSAAECNSSIAFVTKLLLKPEDNAQTAGMAYVPYSLFRSLNVMWQVCWTPEEYEFGNLRNKWAPTAATLSVIRLQIDQTTVAPTHSRKQSAVFVIDALPAVDAGRSAFFFFSAFLHPRAVAPFTSEHYLRNGWAELYYSLDPTCIASAGANVPFSVQRDSSDEITIDIVVNSSDLWNSLGGNRTETVALCARYFLLKPARVALTFLRLASKSASLAAAPRQSEADGLLWISGFSGVAPSIVTSHLYTAEIAAKYSAPNACSDAVIQRGWKEVLRVPLKSLRVEENVTQWAIPLDGPAIVESMTTSSTSDGQILVCLVDDRAEEIVQWESQSLFNVVLQVPAVFPEVAEIRRAEVFFLDAKDVTINVGGLLLALNGAAHSEITAARALAAIDGAFLTLVESSDSGTCEVTSQSANAVRLVNGRFSLRGGTSLLKSGETRKKFLLCSEILPGRHEMLIDLNVLSPEGFALLGAPLFSASNKSALTFIQGAASSSALLSLPAFAADLQVFVKWVAQNLTCGVEGVDPTAASHIIGQPGNRAITLNPTARMCIAFASKRRQTNTEMVFSDANLVFVATSIGVTAPDTFPVFSGISVSASCPIGSSASLFRIVADSFSPSATDDTLAATNFVFETDEFLSVALRFPYDASQGSVYLPFHDGGLLHKLCVSRFFPEQISIFLQRVSVDASLLGNGNWLNFTLYPVPVWQTEQAPLITSIAAPLCSASNSQCLLRLPRGTWKPVDRSVYRLSPSGDCADGLAEDVRSMLSFSGDVLPPLAYIYRLFLRSEWDSTPLQWLTVCAMHKAQKWVPLLLQWGNSTKASDAAVVGFRTLAMDQRSLFFIVDFIAREIASAADGNSVYWTELRNATVIGVWQRAEHVDSSIDLSLSALPDACGDARESEGGASVQLGAVTRCSCGDSLLQLAAAFGFDLIMAVPIDAQHLGSLDQRPKSTAYYICSGVDIPLTSQPSFLPSFLSPTLPHLFVRAIDILQLDAFVQLPVKFNSSSSIGPISLSSSEGLIRTIVFVSSAGFVGLPLCSREHVAAEAVASVQVNHATNPPSFYLPATATVVSGVAASPPPRLVLCICAASPISADSPFVQATASITLNPFGTAIDGIFLAVNFSRVDNNPGDAARLLTMLPPSDVVVQQIASDAAAVLNVSSASAVQVYPVTDGTVHISFLFAPEGPYRSLEKASEACLALYAALVSQRAYLRWPSVEQYSSSLFVSSYVAVYYLANSSAFASAPMVRTDPIDVFSSIVQPKSRSFSFTFVLLLVVALLVALGVCASRCTGRNGGGLSLGSVRTSRKAVDLDEIARSPGKATEMEIVEGEHSLSPMPRPAGVDSPLGAPPPRIDSSRRLEALMQEHEEIRHTIRSLRSVNETKDNPLYDDDAVPLGSTNVRQKSSSSA